jgi:hypothetical protein
MCENKQFLRNKLRNLRFSLLHEQQVNVNQHKIMVTDGNCCADGLADFMDIVSNIIRLVEKAEVETEKLPEGAK